MSSPKEHIISGSILGTRVLRREDQRLLTGSADYVDDLRPDGVLFARFVRSTLAHADIMSVGTEAALAVPGVVAVATSADLEHLAAGSRFPLDPHFARTALARDIVRFQGEPIVVVIARSEAAAADAAELVEIDLAPRPVVVDAERSLAQGEARLYPERGSDVMVTTYPRDDDLHAGADTIVEARIVNSRIAVVPLECHGILAEPRPDGGLVVQISTQGVHATRDGMAAALGLDASMIDVVAPAVGGGFGAKGGWQPEHVVAAHMALQLGQPVSWKEDRSENLFSMHARDQVQHARLGVRADATITSLEVAAVADVGAYPGLGALLPVATRLMAQGTYRIPRIAFDYAAVATNKAPLGAFRGAGRPQATYFLERLMDMTAARLGIDPVEFRRINLLSADELPMTTATGANYDSGNYVGALDKAVEILDYDSLRAEQARRRAAGDPRQLGVGVACYVEVTAPMGTEEFASVEVFPNGRVALTVGTCSHGQGHDTTFSMIVADRLQVPLDSIDLVQSDTRTVRSGGGTSGSRSVQLAGSAAFVACDQLIDQARQLAAHVLEANAADIELVDGGLSVAGVPAARLSWADLAAITHDQDRRPADASPGLIAGIDLDQGSPTFPFGAHVAVVEIDTETGEIELVRMVSVDDCGTVINPLLVEGQQHGGLATGISQALYEHIAYDDEANLITGNLAAYAMPSAAEFPSFETASTQTPTPHNPLGAKGIGEAATIGSTPAVVNAVVDALAPLGVVHLDLPLTPERIWHAISTADETGGAPEKRPWPTLTS